ncbi:hypothetical protein M758_12G032000 [Ceratodon purpureus]|nr:hypothetical protein M758_12G032000 [Ceratodon purpureus]
MIELLELAQGPRNSSHLAEKDRPHRVKLRCAELPIVADCSEFDESKFIRLFSRTLPDLKDGQLSFLRNLCYVAHRSEEFFYSIPTNQWVQTIITYDTAIEKLFSPKSIVEECSRLISIRSNILPCDPFWTKLQAIRDGACQSSVHYPCSVLREGGNILMQKVSEDKKKGGESEICQHGSEHYPSRLLWESEANDEVQKEVKTLKELARGSDGVLWLVTWRGGMFVKKDSREQINSNPRDTPDIEVTVVETLSHPHIVYSFGVSYSVVNRSLFMEYMQYDLFHFIVQRVRTTGDNKPPFLHQDAVGILLQLAKAMAHMHEKNVIHGDLKSQNILINEVLISEGVTHYLVKVADFGSAQFVSSDSESTGFRLEAATTKYAAPEALKMRKDKNAVTFSPKALDVYGFGIVAFEVLTGEKLYRNKSQSEMTKGVIHDGLRPPLRTECGKDNFLQNGQLISLIESCWHGEPKKRPSFLEIADVLDSVTLQILEATPGSNDRYPPPIQENITSDALHGQVPRPSRLHKHPEEFPRKLLRPFSCLSGGKVL